MTKASDRAYESFRKALPPTGAKLLVVGPAGRVWREDQLLLHSVLEDLRPAVVLMSDIRPFDTILELIVSGLGIEFWRDEPENYPLSGKGPKVRGRSLDLYEAADGIVALPLEAAPPVSRGGTILKPSSRTQVKYDVFTADPGMITAPKKPTLALYRYFSWESTS